MKLPNAKQAVVERAKVTDYLLNAAHPDNGGKAAFFEGLGFHRTRWKALAEALQRLAAEADVSRKLNSPHGDKFVVEGWLESPDHKAAFVKTIWIVDNGMKRARLVTAYPGKD